MSSNPAIPHLTVDQTKISAMETFQQQNSTITYTFPSSPEYDSLRNIFNDDCQARPLAIARPQTATDVSSLIIHAKSLGIGFTVRSGGHNLAGLTVTDGTLTIDMRDLTQVDVSSDRKSATVGGGILQQELAENLWKEGLVTPTGTIGPVGYVGWATYGGYGALSGHWGLGVDQIMGATIVNADGEILKVDSKNNSDLLKGIRGAGGVFGVIVDLTIKVYPLKNFLGGMIMFESSDIKKTIIDFNAAYRALQEQGIPPELTIQQAVVNAPPGRTFAVIFGWSSDDIETGQKWRERIATLGPTTIMNTVIPTSPPEWLTANGGIIPDEMYGISRTHNVRQITPDLAELLGEYMVAMPFSPGTMFTIHQMRGPSASEVAGGRSVFAQREPHFMLEILGYSTVPEGREVSVQWAKDLWEAIRETGSSNTLPNTYISLDVPEGDLDLDALERYFGPHVQDVLDLKRKYDPDNVFALSVPRLGDVTRV